MAAVPAVPSVTGGVYLAATQSQLAQAISFEMNPPIAKLRQATIQSIPNTTWTPLTFDTHDVDSVLGHSDSTNNSRYTAQYAGWYEAAGGYSRAQSATGQRGTKFTVNGADVNGSGTFFNGVSASGDGSPARTTFVYLNVGDYLELQVWQNTGGALNTDVSALYFQSSMTVRWVSN